MTPSTATPFAPIHLAPDPAATRLLTGWYETGRPATLTDHLRRYGPPPVDRTLGGRGIPPLVDIVEAAGLTGRGGAGFPAATKLRAVTERRGRAVVVVNAMESEPASCKDQFLLGVAPHLVLDGAVLAATAVGADTVHVCAPHPHDPISPGGRGIGPTATRPPRPSAPAAARPATRLCLQ